MNCPECNKELLNGKYICTEEDYRITSLDNTTEFIYTSHEISPEDDEVGTSIDIYYCICEYWIPIN